MECQNPEAEDGKFIYKGIINCDSTGNYGYTLRILPNHPLFINPFEFGLIKWA
jgi:starch phosphorylase